MLELLDKLKSHTRRFFLYTSIWIAACVGMIMGIIVSVIAMQQNYLVSGVLSTNPTFWTGVIVAGICLTVILASIGVIVGTVKELVYLADRVRSNSNLAPAIEKYLIKPVASVLIEELTRDWESGSVQHNQENVSPISERAS